MASGLSFSDGRADGAIFGLYENSYVVLIAVEVKANIKGEIDLY